MVTSEKKHDTGLRILEILKLMLKNDISKHQMIDLLKDNCEIGSVYTQEAFIKYFNTLEALGFNIEKEKNNYSLKNGLFSISLNENELNLFKLLIKNYNFIYKKEEAQLFKNLIIRINKHLENKLPKEFLDKIFSPAEEKNNNLRENIILTLKKMISEELPIKVKYKKGKNIETEITIKPKELTEKKGNIYISGFCPDLKCNKKICIDTITSISQSVSKFKQTDKAVSIVFELYGRLAKSYKLKPDERYLNSDVNTLTIINDGEDKDNLLLRLLKYGENCKILKPEEVQEEFLALTDDILKNLEEN